MKSDIQTSAFVNHHPEGRAHFGLTFRGKVETLYIGCYCRNLGRKSYHLTLILFHKTAGDKSKIIDKNKKDCNALINHLCKQHPSPLQPHFQLDLADLPDSHLKGRHLNFFICFVTYYWAGNSQIQLLLIWSLHGNIHRGAHWSQLPEENSSITQTGGFLLFTLLP